VDYKRATLIIKGAVDFRFYKVQENDDFVMNERLLDG